MLLKRQRNNFKPHTKRNCSCHQNVQKHFSFFLFFSFYYYYFNDISCILAILVLQSSFTYLCTSLIFVSIIPFYYSLDPCMVRFVLVFFFIYFVTHSLTTMSTVLIFRSKTLKLFALGIGHGAWYNSHFMHCGENLFELLMFNVQYVFIVHIYYSV